MKTKDKARDAFEAWARVNLNYLDGPYLRDCNDIDPEYTYQDPTTESHWNTWQAATEANKDKLRDVRDVIKVFADCCQWFDDNTDDEEWAKMRLLVKDYRNAAKAIETLTNMIEGE